MNFEQLANIITDTHQQLQQSAVKAVNQCQTVRNWLMGFYIVEFEQNGVIEETGTADKSKRAECYLISTFQNVLWHLSSIQSLD